MKSTKLIHSLRFKLIASTVVIQILFVSLLVADNIQLVQESFLEQSKIRISEIERLLNASLGAPLVQQDIEVLNEIINDSIQKKGIVRLVLLGLDGKAIASVGGQKPVTIPPKSHSLLDSIIKEFPTYNSSIPIKVEGVSYGELHYGISTKFLTETKSFLFRSSLSIAITGIVISSIALFVICMWLTRNLKDLTAISQKFAKGEMNARVEFQSKDEVALLADAFNSMAQTLATRIEDLNVSRSEQSQLLIVSLKEKARLKSLLAVMARGILFETTDDRVEYYNPSFMKMWDLPSSLEITHMPVLQIVEFIQDDVYAGHELDWLLNKEVSSLDIGSVESKLPDGRYVIQKHYPVFDEKRNRIGTLWTFEDTTMQRHTAEQLIYLAEHDFLTGLFNRRKFQEELHRYIERCNRQNCELAIVFFDVDDFKNINDVFGHKCGDELLVKIANDIGTLVRKNELFCRLGGDEFAILIIDGDEYSATQLADRIIQAISNIFIDRDNRKITITSSVGISMYPKHSQEQDELLAYADLAMYQAKDSGKNTWKVYEKSLDNTQRVLKRMDWNDRISQALEKGLFYLNFQGVFDAKNNQLNYLEALVRMRDVSDPSVVIPPGQFVPFAERSGSIIEIDRMVIEEVIKILASNPSINCMAVNVSGRSFDDLELASFIIHKLKVFSVDAKRLLIEVTETSAVSDINDAQRFIELMCQSGCRVAIDDFGSGYASLLYLKHLQADVIKIDGLFSYDLANDHENQVFIKSIVNMARGLNKQTVAEFVEDEVTLNMLTELGVDYVQGFYLHKPSESFSIEKLCSLKASI